MVQRGETQEGQQATGHGEREQDGYDLQQLEKFTGCYLLAAWQREGERVGGVGID